MFCASIDEGVAKVKRKFLIELKETEKRDSVLTPQQQINRLLRPGSSYANLNPFQVLEVDPTTPVEEIKKKFRRLSILVHPDKNPDDKERAQRAFDELTKSWRVLENDETRKKCLEIVEEAEFIVNKRIDERKKQLKREGKDTKLDEDDPEKLKRAIYVQTMKLFADMERKRRQQEQRDMEERKRKREEEIQTEERKKAEKEWQKNFEIDERKKQLKREGKDTKLDEDDPEKLKRAIYVQTMKLFADMERKRRQQEQRDMEERKRKREEEIQTEERKKAEKEWQKNFEESREDRVNSWKDFQKGKSKKFKGFKPPKHKAESR
ncbi:DnaJ-like protein subfamily C member 8 [Armadillidium vulgare]|nr:DnaJ-like protein subfamily C member 8 [Armadillidium vulgare]